jgi:hypothetical protein
MSAPTRPEVWLRGPLLGIDPVLMPAAHTLVQAREEIAAAAAGASDADLWARPAGAAEHTSRHTGQFITTLRIARGLRASPAA